MKYRIEYEGDDNETKILIEEFEDIADFENWEAEQKSLGMKILDVTNIYEMIKFNPELSTSEKNMLINSQYGRPSSIKCNGEVSTFEYNNEVMNLKQSDGVLTISKGSGDDIKPHYFLRKTSLMCMEMFKRKYQYSE